MAVHARLEATAAMDANEQRALRRARHSLRCLPFRRAFYEQLDTQALSSVSLCNSADWARLCLRRLNPSRAEDHFIWLIQLGVLRREVDGQGLTERVRLTPMGRTLLAQWPDEIPAATLLDRLQHGLRRHRPRL
jgi:hypothetical protein